MSVVKGLKNINALLDKPKDSNSPKVRWLNLTDGQAAKIRFINELDGDSPAFNESRGLAVVIAEHSNPKDYKRKATCTMESQGRCYGCEMARKEPKSGWRAKLRFYINVLVDEGTGEDPYVAVWSQGVSKQSAFNTIREYALETGSVSNLQWKIKRNGLGTETNYTLIPTPDKEDYKWGDLELFNLEKVVREIDYTEQEAFYFGFDTPTTTASNMDW